MEKCRLEKKISRLISKRDEYLYQLQNYDTDSEISLFYSKEILVHYLDSVESSINKYKIELSSL